MYYPRTDGCSGSRPGRELIDGALAQDLVDCFVAAGAVDVFMGLYAGLSGT